jgi:hypothetical protein
MSNFHGLYSSFLYRHRTPPAPAVASGRPNAVFQGWLVVQNDALTLTTAGLAGGLMAVR